MYVLHSTTLRLFELTAKSAVIIFMFVVCRSAYPILCKPSAIHSTSDLSETLGKNMGIRLVQAHHTFVYFHFYFRSEFPCFHVFQLPAN